MTHIQFQGKLSRSWGVGDNAFVVIVPVGRGSLYESQNKMIRENPSIQDMYSFLGEASKFSTDSSETDSFLQPSVKLIVS